MNDGDASKARLELREETPLSHSVVRDGWSLLIGWLSVICNQLCISLCVIRECVCECLSVCVCVCVFACAHVLTHAHNVRRGRHQGLAMYCF